MDLSQIIDLLQCTVCGGDLSATGDSVTCESEGRHRFAIESGVLNFVEDSEGESYSDHWDRADRHEVSQRKLAQAREFMGWFMPDLRPEGFRNKVFLDIGCGDGNHLPFMPEEARKIAIDYSKSVKIVSERYGDLRNLFVIRADALHLPLKSGMVDYVISYGCLNCLEEPREGLEEASRVLRSDGVAAFWGYGTRSLSVRTGLYCARGIYRYLALAWLRKLFVHCLVPSLYFVRNSTGIRPGESPLRECLEIISTNLVPEHLHLFGKSSWRELAPEALSYIEDHHLPCGQKFRKG